MDDHCEQHEEGIGKSQPLIGVNEGDFEIIFVDGVLGFGLSVASSAALIMGFMNDLPHATNYSWSFVIPVGVAFLIASAICCVMLRLGQITANWIQGPLGKKTTLSAHLVSYLAALVCCFFGLRFAVLVFAAAGLALTIFCYARFLVSLTRRALMVVFDSVFLICGIYVFALPQFTSIMSFVIVAIGVLVSLTVGLVRLRESYAGVEPISIEDSKQRCVTIIGHNYTIFTIGFMFAPTVLVFGTNQPSGSPTLDLGIAIGLAGVASIVFERMDERTYKEAFKKNMTVVAALFLLTAPLLPSEWRTITLSVYLCLVAINAIILLNAVVETSRFNMISPVYLLGKDGSVFCFGAAIGYILFLICGLSSFEDSSAMFWACSVAVVIVSLAQVHINYQVYPFEPQIDVLDGGEKDMKARDLIEQSGNHKRTYQQKREYACEVFRLSPREREILRLLLKGRDAKYIMNEFYISQSTAKTHIYNIYRKFEVHSRQELLDFIEAIELPDTEDQERRPE